MRYISKGHTLFCRRLRKKIETDIVSLVFIQNINNSNFNTALYQQIIPKHLDNALTSEGVKLFDSF